METKTKRVGLLVREKINDEVKHRIQDAQACFFLGFNRIGAFPFNVMRNDLKDASASVYVTKNTLLKRVFQELGWSDFEGFLEGETGIVFVYSEDIIAACKILVGFASENETFTLKGGVLKEKRINTEELKALAKLPSKEVLIQMAVSSLASPLTSFLSVMQQNILKFVWVVEEMKKKKEDAG